MTDAKDTLEHVKDEIKKLESPILAAKWWIVGGTIVGFLAGGFLGHVL